MTQPDKKYEQPDWVIALKETGAEVFDMTGLPTPANEDWKYSSLRPYERVGFAHTDAAPQVSVADLPAKKLTKRIVFINGIYNPEHSDDISGLKTISLAEYISNNGTDTVSYTHLTLPTKA